MKFTQKKHKKSISQLQGEIREAAIFIQEATEELMNRKNDKEESVK
jgi:hypothetical protein